MAGTLYPQLDYSTDVDHPGKEGCVPRRSNFLQLRQTLEELSPGDEFFVFTIACCVPSTVLGIEDTTVKTDNKVLTRAGILVGGKNRISKTI